MIGPPIAPDSALFRLGSGRIRADSARSAIICVKQFIVIPLQCESDRGYFPVRYHVIMVLGNSGIFNMPDRQRPKVLIIDDNEMSRMLLRGILRDEEYEVVGEATNGKHGIEMALTLKPDIVCLDNMMPEMSGVEVLSDIRAKLPQISIVMVTASADRETVQAALQGGADGYVVKPFNSGRVLAALEQALAKARSKKAAT